MSACVAEEAKRAMEDERSESRFELYDTCSLMSWM